MAPPPTLTPDQHRIMALTERITASLSIFGILFIILTYLFSSSFCKPINRLVFYASWGNLGLCIVALISVNGPDAGKDSALCQFQGLMAQLFLGVDAYWAFCMAVNIYLVFFRSYNTRQLKSLDHKYFIACYGLSLIPAIVYLFIRTEGRGKIYGGAVLWCWVSGEWDFLRIAVLYVFMWVAVLIAIIIYIMAGRYVWKKRDTLDGFLNPFNEDPFYSSVMTTTEVTVTSQDRVPVMPRFGAREVGKSHVDDDFNPYSCNIEIGETQRPERPRRPSRPAMFRLPSVTRAVALSQENVESFLYARVAFLFFIALLVTWVPSSINRAYALAHPEHINWGLNFTSAIVFSIQGLLNCVVYIATSQSACRKLWAKILRRNYDSSSRKETYTTYGVGRDVGRTGRKKLGSDTTSVTNLTAP